MIYTESSRSKAVCRWILHRSMALLANSLPAFPPWKVMFSTSPVLFLLGFTRFEASQAAAEEIYDLFLWILCVFSRSCCSHRRLPANIFFVFAGIASSCPERLFNLATSPNYKPRSLESAQSVSCDKLYAKASTRPCWLCLCFMFISSAGMFAGSLLLPRTNLCWSEVTSRHCVTSTLSPFFPSIQSPLSPWRKPKRIHGGVVGRAENVFKCVCVCARYGTDKPGLCICGLGLGQQHVHPDNSLLCKIIMIRFCFRLLHPPKAERNGEKSQNSRSIHEFDGITLHACGCVCGGGKWSNDLRGSF